MGDLATAGGQWVHRKKDEHVCPKPTRASVGLGDVKRGDQWQCDTCHKIYTVTGLNSGDQRDEVYPPIILWGPGYTPEVPKGWYANG